MTRIVLSHTQIELFEQCPRKYSYVYRHNLDKPVGVAALWSRELLHAPLAALYNGTAGLVSWQVRWDRYVEKYGALVLSGPPYDLATAQACYTEYTQRFYWPDQMLYSALPPEEMRYYETVADGQNEVLYLSIPDVVLVERGTGATIPLDFKASKRPSPMLVTNWNRQFVGQAAAVGATRFFTNVFTLESTKGGRPRVSVIRHESEISPDLMAEWESELCATARHIVDCDTHNVWPKSAPSACFAYGERCAFADVCGAGALRGPLIDAMPKKPPREEH